MRHVISILLILFSFSSSILQAQATETKPQDDTIMAPYPDPDEPLE